MAGQLGVTVDQVGRSFAAATSSSRFVAPNYWADPRTGIAFQVQVEVPQPRMTSLDDLRVVPVSADARVAPAARRRGADRERHDRRRIRSHQRPADGDADGERRRARTSGGSSVAVDAGDRARRRAAARRGGHACAARSRAMRETFTNITAGLARGRRRDLSAAGRELSVAAARVRRRLDGAGRADGRGADARGDADDAERAVVHGRDHGDRRRRGERHPAGDVRRSRRGGTGGSPLRHGHRGGAGAHAAGADDERAR